MTRYAFQDEFDGPAGSPPDPARWRNDLGGGGWGHGDSTVHSAVHAPAGGASVRTARRDLPSDTGWHTYRLDWSADGMSFSRDRHRYLIVRRGFCGSRAWVYGPGEPHNGGMFLLLNLAVGGQVGDPPDSTRFPADLMVDYVRVTQP